MKKLIILSAVAACALISGCGNIDMIDMNYTFHKALVKWPDGSMKEIEIERWTDYEGEQIQIVGKDGKIYLVSMNKTVLIHD